MKTGYLIIFILLCALYFAMTAFPFVLSSFAPKPGDKRRLNVRANNRKDPRFFVKSFQSIFSKAMENGIHNGVLHLSKDEPVFPADQITPETQIVPELLVEAHSFSTDHPMEYQKEVYVRGDASLASGTTVRAITAKNLRLDSDSTVIRWADGEESAVCRDGCNLGTSFTSAGRLLVGKNSSFQKLYAPEICIGDSFLEEETEASDENEPKNKTAILRHYLTLLEASYENDPKNKTLTRNLREVSAGTAVNATIVTKNDLSVGESARIFGDVKSNRKITIGRNAVICGNVFADGSIVIEDGARILGDVFSQEDIYLGSGAVIGSSGKIKSLLARRNIYLSEGSRIYGYIGCEHQGWTMAGDELSQSLGRLA